MAAFLILAGSAIYAQEDSTSVARDFLDRFTMPVLQGGYIDHVTDEIEEFLYFTFEVFGNHVLDQDYFWTENQWAWGANIGLSALLL